MKLTTEGLADRKEWEEKGYHLPQYDREAMIRKTKEHPEWVHFGAGNIFRAFHANLAQKLLEQGDAETGITVCEGFDYEIIEKQYRPHDNLSVLVTLKADGSIDKSVIGAVGESTILDSENAAEFGRLKEIFSADSLKLCTFTVTEKGYSLVNGKGEMLPAVSGGFCRGAGAPAELYREGGFTPLHEISGGREAGRDGVHGQLFAERGKAVPGGDGLREGMDGERDSGCGIHGLSG